MTQNRLTYLYQRYIADACTPDELQEFKAILKQSTDNAQLAQLMDDTWDKLPESANDINDEAANRIYHQIIAQPQATKRNNYLWLKIAASVILIVSAGLLLHSVFPGSKKQNTVAGQPIAHVILPGGNKAILTLANGTKIKLNENVKGRIAVQSNSIINKPTGGQLVYTASPASSSATALSVLNTLTVPTGGQYAMVLADGTKVFLNSESSLTYPTSFSGNQRNVTLTGEAYFEVAKNAAKPFKVNVAGKQQVEVLGTHFNIMAYADDHHIKTTLLEGSVKLSTSGYQTILKPGQMAYQDLNTATVTVQSVDVDEAIAWKNGYFKFRHEDIKSIMKKISRWYNIDVVYNGTVTNHTFGGIYVRNQELSELLKGLEYTGLVHFKTEGRRVTVMP